MPSALRPYGSCILLNVLRNYHHTQQKQAEPATSQRLYGKFLAYLKIFWFCQQFFQKIMAKAYKL